MQLQGDLLNLVELAMDIPLNQEEEEEVDRYAKYILDIGSHSELENLKAIKVRALVAQKVNKTKEDNARKREGQGQ